MIVDFVLNEFQLRHRYETWWLTWWPDSFYGNCGTDCEHVAGFLFSLLQAEPGCDTERLRSLPVPLLPTGYDTRADRSGEAGPAESAAVLREHSRSTGEPVTCTRTHTHVRTHTFSRETHWSAESILCVFFSASASQTFWPEPSQSCLSLQLDPDIEWRRRRWSVLNAISLRWSQCEPKNC